ncbi:hypothetical protein Q0Z83_001500 [Actinoplanes sichuanensis]|uniref:Uncharacterized protein n=1 Tax=Actinoplanes sichuanensis TaxID=512349 RepID=A0ABW4ARS3_9ACTN|nr:hypothetical protein [Actinoplanes sichuanensis]BEL01959.1 hypothetical protein Q0Z83_001500 [Actinoplanes sichuanensis]
MTVRYPWPTFTAPLRCRLTDVHLDGRPLPADLIDDSHYRVRLDGMSTWESFECEVVLSTDEAMPTGVDRLTGYVMVSSSATNTRLPFPLTAADGSLVGRITVVRGAVAGGFTVAAEVGGDVAGRRRVVGSSDPWTVVLDHREAPVPPGAPPFAMSWADFNSSAAPAAARQTPDALAFMDVTGEPRLWLNAGVPGLQALLDNNHAKLERRRLRDILSTTIARNATSALFRAAAAEVVSYGDEPPQPPATALYRQVCQAVADQMIGIAGVDELYEQLVAQRDDPLGNADLWRRIDAAVDTLTGSLDALTTASQEVSHG